MRIGAIIQARMGSSRLPKKVMLSLEGKTVLEHVIERVRQSVLIDEVIVATTIHEQDSVIYTESLKCGARVSRGSEEDVLSRYYFAALENKLDIVVRITSDCPLIDPKLIDDIVEFYKKESYDIVSNAGSELSSRTYPRGLDVEIFSLKILKDAFENAAMQYHREHVTPYIYENSKNIYYYRNNVDLSNYRWTLDTPEDYTLISEIYKVLYKGQHNFYMEEVLELFKNNPTLYAINEFIQQKKLDKQV